MDIDGPSPYPYRVVNFRRAYLVLGTILAGTLLAIVIFLCLVTRTIEVNPAQTRPVQITRSMFGTTRDGDQVDKYTLSNDAGMKVDVITLGGTLTSIKVPDKNGKIDDVIIGFDDVAGYESSLNPYSGSLIGRYANRIAAGTFTLDDATYHVTLNTHGDPPTNHLHGGTVGWDKHIWAAEIKEDSLILGLESPDGDQGFPGHVTCNVTFRLTLDNQLHIEFRADVTRKATPINLTSHPYFNLAGHASGTLYDHEITIRANAFLPVGEGLIPSGEIAPVTGSAFDFRQPTRLGDRIDNSSSGIDGYDHNFCLSGTTGKRSAATLHHPLSGRVLSVYTDQPGLQVYTGDYLDIQGQGKGGASYRRHSAVALETQNFPDAPNHANFPDSVLQPGDTYVHNVWYAFSTGG